MDMVDDYNINLENYSLTSFKEELLNTELIPSRRILKDEIDLRFRILSENGVENLQELLIFLKTPKKAAEFAKITGLPEDYLLILRREVNSYQTKPIALEKFPGIKNDTILKLKSVGIKNTAHLFKRVKTPEERNKLAMETGVSDSEILELTKLTDLSRVKWIGPTFARIFLDSGTDTVDKLSKSNYKILYKKLIDLNNLKGYTKANFIEKDVLLCVKVSKMVPNVIRY
jgi:hypothetical protein